MTSSVTPIKNVIQYRDEILDKFMSTPGKKTIIGYGSLMSEISSKTTFPNLHNFRTVEINGMIRIFSQPAAIFFERRIADISERTVCSLCVEKNPDHSFKGVAFDLTDANDIDSDTFLLREEEFNFDIVMYKELSISDVSDIGSIDQLQTGLICTRSTDEIYHKRWGIDRFNERYQQYGCESIWKYDASSGLLPCSLYLRHCYLAASKLGDDMLMSFLDETYLIDRTTTVREYLKLNKHILELQPPQNLIGRYSG